MIEESRDYQDTFRFRLNNEMAIRGLKAVDLCRLTGIPKAAMSLYINGKNEPKTDRIYLIAKALSVNPVWLMGFNVDKEAIIETNSPEKSDEYYIDEKTMEVAQELKENRELAILFDAARDASAEDLKAVHAMLLALKRKDNRE